MRIRIRDRTPSHDVRSEHSRSFTARIASHGMRLAELILLQGACNSAGLPL
jgi:hypothetical protein